MTILQSMSRLLVPEEILASFTIVKIEQTTGIIKIILHEKDELNFIPREVVFKGKVVKDGFCNVLELQTFPTLGKEVFLYIYRRRWKIRSTNKHYSNKYNFHEKGMKATHKFGIFLKEIGRS